MKARADAKGIEFKVNFKGLLPENLITDPTRLKQIISNIVCNAIKFTEHGYVHLNFEFKEEEDLLRIECVDTGIGIFQAQQEKLFQAFSQGEASMTRTHGGTGLGLVLVKKISQEMGGEFFLKDSSLGEGSVFVVHVKAKKGKKTERWLESFSPENRNGKFQNQSLEFSNSLTGMKVLVVEDSPDNRDLLEIVLTRWGIDLAFAIHGQEALEKIGQESYDVILMDIQMPVMDGYQTIHRLREGGYQGYVVALIAHVLRDEIEKCLSAGFSNFSHRPLDLAHLHKILLSRISLRGEAEESPSIL